MMITDGLKLYHGSYMEVSCPDIRMCRYGKDFGRGFYLTTDKEQAIRFTKTAVKKAVFDGRIDGTSSKGFVSEFVYNEGGSLNIYEFKNADSEWLHCVVAHRKSGLENELGKWKDYDIICGKIANDNTNLVITTYMDGLYGEVFSEAADNIAIGFLEPDNLKDQICMRTDRAIESLRFTGSKEVEI